MKTRRDILKSLAVLPALGVPALAASKERVCSPETIQGVLDAFAPRDSSPAHLIRHEFDAVQKTWESDSVGQYHRVHVDLRDVCFADVCVMLKGADYLFVGPVLDVRPRGDRLVMRHLVEVNDRTRRFITYYNMGLPFGVEVSLSPDCSEFASMVILRPIWS